MASFAQNQKTQFSPYTPQLNSGVLANALASKSEDYKAGAAKVQATVDSIAGLPVSTEREREYLSGKIKGITSDINAKVGTNFDNLNQVNTISGHIASIANDPIVQSATQSTYSIKEGNTKQKTNQDKHGGATVSNDSDWNDKLQEWHQNGKLGETFKGDYSDYFDKQKYTDDYFAKKHPDQKVRFEMAGFDRNGKPLSEAKIYQWDAVKHTWEGVKQDEVAKEMRELIETSPELAKQLTIDAKYKGKSYDASTYGTVVRDHHLDQISRNNILYNQYLVEQGKYKEGDSEYNEIHNKLDDLITDSNTRVNYLKTGLKEDMFKYQIDPEFKDKFDLDLYKDKWVNSQADLYSWGKNNKELIGDSPRKAWYEHEKMLQENRKDTNTEKAEAFKETLETAKIKETKRLDDAKIAKLTGGLTKKDGTPLSLADIKIDANSIPQSPLEQTEKKLVDTDNDLEHTKYKYMHDVLGEKANDMLVKDANGYYVPTPDSKTVVDKFYDDLREAYENGGKDKEGKQIIDESDKDHFDAIAEKLVDRDLTNQNIQRANKAWDKEVKTNPEIKRIEDKLNSFKPLSLGNGEFLTSDDIRKFAKLRPEVEKMKLSTTHPEEQDQKALELYQQHGLSETKVNTFIFNNPVSDITSALEKLPTTKEKFLDKQVSGGVDEGIIYNNQQSVGMFTKDPKVNNQIKRNIIQIANARTEAGDKTYSILAENPNNFQLAYTQDPDTKKYSILVQDPTGKALPSIPLTDNEANNLNLEDIVTVDPTLQRISNNWNAGKNTGDPAKGGMNFKTSFHDDIVVKDPNINEGNPTKIRHGVEYKSTGWYVVLFGKDMKTGKETRVMQLKGQPTWEDAKTKLNNLLSKYQGKDEEVLQLDTKSQRYSVDPNSDKSTAQTAMEDNQDEDNN